MNLIFLRRSENPPTLNNATHYIYKPKQYQARRSSDAELPKKVEAKVRASNLKYAVNMVINYHHPRLIKGVICDWDFVEGLYTNFLTMILISCKILFLFCKHIEIFSERYWHALLTYVWNMLCAKSREKEGIMCDAAVRQAYHQQLNPCVKRCKLR